MKRGLLRTLCLALVSVAACGDDGASETSVPTTTGTDGTTSTSTTGDGSTSTGTSSSTSTSSNPTSSGSTTSTSDGSTGGSSSGSTGLADNYFNNTIQPIFTANCGCHSPTGPGSFQDLTPGSAYSQIVGVPSQQVPTLDRVEPGNLDESYLWHKLSGTHTSVGGSGSRMPQGGILPSEETMIIMDWILDGAPLE